MKTSYTKKNIRIRFILVGLVAAIILAFTGSAKAATWIQKADMPTARWAHSSAVVDGKIYVIGGVTSEPSYRNGKPISAVEEYDPAKDTWTRRTDMPEARGYLHGSSLPVVDGRIYVIGGGDPASARVDIYDPVTDTWSRGADMPTPRLIFARVAFEGKIYAFGGLAGLGASDYGLKTTEVYDPQTDTWTQAARMPQGVWGHSAEVVDGMFYVIGGAYNINALQILQVYDPRTDTWTNATPKPLNTRGFGTTEVCGKIYAFGGWLNSGQNPYSNTWVYDPASNIWSETVPLPEARATLSTSLVNGKIYAIGGTPVHHNCRATSTVYELSLDYPPPDFNGDGVVNGADAAILVDHWHTDNPLYDIAPAPCGDGIVDVQDLIVLSEHLLGVVNDPTLVTHWALDESEGDIAFDSAGTNDASVIGEPLWLPAGGHVDGAIQLDGIDDVVVADSPLDPAKGPFSVFTWIRGGDVGQAVISEAGWSNWLSIHPLTGCLMTELTSLGRSGGPLVSETPIIDGQWHRIGLVWDGATRTLIVDGAAVAQDTQNSLVSSVGGFYIGAGKDTAPGTFFSGLIDDVRIYNRTVRP